MGEQAYDVAVVGAGAAGLMTAITAARAGARTLLIDRRQRIGAKILISGGTRCNLTNRTVSVADYQSSGSRAFIKHVLSAFNEQQAVSFFKSLGVPVVLEPSGKYFPSTHSGRTVLEALLRAAREAGVELVTGVVVDAVRVADGAFVIDGKDDVTGERGSFRTGRVALATGGLSYPQTGSDGIGYRIAAALGHALVETTPSLTPLVTGDMDFRSLSGIALPVAMTLWTGGRQTTTVSGSFLFTHVGFSGPAALDISRHWLRTPKSRHPELTASFLPEQAPEGAREMMAAARAEHAQRTVKRWLAERVPERLAEVLLDKASVPPSTVWAQVTTAQREALVRWLFSAPLSVTGSLGYAKAEVTAGGVPLAGVHHRTMESRLVPGLYFVGEILDVDGRIGGFNFQWAWSTGVVAGRSMAMGCR